MNKSFQVTIEKLVPGGEGLARIEGKVLLVPYVIPGEQVEVKIVKDKSQYFQGEVIKILTPSPERRPSPCPLFMKCGGCDWLHINFPEQINQKALLIKEAFKRTGKIELPEFKTLSGRELGYRNRVQFHKNEKGQFGFMEKNSNRIVPLKGCPVLHPQLEKFIQSPEAFPNPQIKPGQKLALFTNGEKENNLPAQFENRRAPLVVNIRGKKIHFNSHCFFQSNLALLPALIDFVMENLKGKVVMDLFCGTGLFGAFARDFFDTVIAVEINKESLNYAKKNIPGKNHQFISKDVSQLNRELLHNQDVDCVIVDPPRNGLSSKSKDFLFDLKPRKIIYVSCNPVTQARDLRDFLKHGYQWGDFRAFDFYPQTSHCETVLKLTLP